MTYVIDTCSLIVLGNFYPNRFPSVWALLGELVADERLISVREVLREFQKRNGSPHMFAWVRANNGIFLSPSQAEMAFVSQIFSVPHFQNAIPSKARFTGSPVADPFVIASAWVRGGCVVTQEELRPNAAKIPNICAHFGIECTNLEGLMAAEGWQF